MGRRAVAAQNRKLFVGAAACLLLGSACLSDVELPDCVVNDTCGEAGEGGAEASAGAGNGQSGSGTWAPGGDAGQGSGGTGAGGDTPGAGVAGQGAEGGAPLCPPCSISPATLPAGCQGEKYETLLTVQEGEPPYQWELLSPSSGWSLASAGADRAVLGTSVVSAGRTKLRVATTDARGYRKEATVEMQARTSCWFAYVAPESGDGKLHLVDPMSQQRIVPEHNQGVYDFQFSPDGKQVAYSYGASASRPRGQHLSLIDLKTRTERAVSLAADAVHSFAWSPDGAQLAVAFDTQQGRRLGAVRPSDLGVASLGGIPARVEEGLSWVGNRFVAYHAELFLDAGGVPVDNPQRLRTAFHAELGSSGFLPEVAGRARSASNATLRATGAGFYMLSSGGVGTTFFRLESAAPAERGHDLIALLGPSGSYSASLFEAEPLAIQSADLGVSSPVFTAGEGEDCHLALAWAEQGERVACVANVPNGGEGVHGEVRFFDIPSAGDALHTFLLPDFCEDDTEVVGAASCLEQEAKKYSYSVDLARNAARAFSPSGNWFAFTRLTDDDWAEDEDQVTDGDTYLYVAKLNGQAASLFRRILIPRDGEPNRPTSLSFSRDERFLLLQRGRLLMLFELEGRRLSVPMTEKLKPLDDGADCSEDFADAPDRHCGSTERSAPFIWSPDSLSVAFHTLGAFTVADITPFSDFRPYPQPAPDCGDACSGRFAFQPRFAAP